MNLASLLKILQTIQTVYPLVVDTVKKLLDALKVAPTLKAGDAKPDDFGSGDAPADPEVVAACEHLLAACKAKE